MLGNWRELVNPTGAAAGLVGQKVEALAGRKLSSNHWSESFGGIGFGKDQVPCCMSQICVSVSLHNQATLHRFLRHCVAKTY